MLDVIKSAIPSPIKKALYPIKQRTYDQWYKKRLFKKMQVKHAELIEQVKGKQKIRVVFLAIHESVWKVDPVFKKMLEDPFFEPEILICPYTVYGEERMLEDMQQAYNYFISKGYPVRKAREENGSWVKLSDIKPDIVFFTNPHNLTRKEYYEDAYLNYLSCYVPYAHDVSKYDNYISQYNQNFHNAIWKIFLPHHEDLQIFRMYSKSSGINTLVTGYPATEALLCDANANPWLNNNKKKVIWAPHHTIDDPILPYSNFLNIAEGFRDLTKAFEEDVQFVFKPHPMLKSKLYRHIDWGIERTNEYYNFWDTHINTQLELGEYYDLFLHSDAMIHDSGSFLAEYQYVKKPVLYFCNDKTKNFLNDFGIAALESCYTGFTLEDITAFLNNLVNGSLIVDSSFFDNKVHPFFYNSSPSKKIINSLKKSIT